MNSLFHQLITIDALTDNFSAVALKEIVTHNIRQDSIKNQFFHDEIHFDNNKFAEGNQLIEYLHNNCVDSIKQDNFADARSYFGKLIHTVQDFYAHSNYARLTKTLFENKTPNNNHTLDCLNPAIIKSSLLKSHTVNFPFDYLCIIPLFARWFSKFCPEDSHARMNLDTPQSDGPFDLAYKLAVIRTRIEYQAIITGNHLSNSQLHAFHGI